MSKISQEVIEEAIEKIIQLSEEKKRNFVETIELQVALKNYDPIKDKRFAGSIKLPTIPREGFKICVLGTDKDCDSAKQINVPCMDVAALTALNKNKKLVKKLAAQYHAFLASATLIRKIPRLLGPGLNKAGKFPTVLLGSMNMQANCDELASTVKFQLKSKKTTCLGVAIGNVKLSKDLNVQNIVLAINFLVSLLPKNWQQIKRVYLKSTMGPSQRVFGF